MEITVRREIFTDVSTIGSVYLSTQAPGSKPFCYVLEDKDRGLTQDMAPGDIAREKIYGKTCIPYGRYLVLITQSERFSKLKGRPFFTPQLLDVPGFSGIRIHPGNTAIDTLGCLLPGMFHSADTVYDSRTANAALMEQINISLKLGESVWCNITKAN